MLFRSLCLALLSAVPPPVSHAPFPSLLNPGRGQLPLSKVLIENSIEDFPGAAVVKNPPANAGNTGSIPGPGRYHMPRSN